MIFSRRCGLTRCQIVVIIIMNDPFHIVFVGPAPVIDDFPQILLFPLATTSKRIRPRYLSTPPAFNQGVRFLHWLTSKYPRLWHPSLIASTPMPVTRTQPRTLSSCRSRRWRPMERREESETAEPQKERLSLRRWGHPRARTSVAVSERAQQKDWNGVVSKGGKLWK